MKIKLLFVALLFLIPFWSIGQIDPLLQRLNSYQEKHVREKIHLHFDKNIYSAGETIWFKMYCLTAPENMPSGLSKVADIDLIGPNGKIVKSIKIPLASGLGMGDFKLQDTITEGTYRVRAYTNWMRNDSSAYFFEKIIPVTNGRSDNMITNTSLVDNGNKKALQINFKTLSGLSSPNIKVNYSINYASKTKTGNEKIDELGNLLIPVQENYYGGILTLNFESAEGRTIKKIFHIPDPAKQNSLQIFPEGGNFIDQTITTTGIKTLSPNGLGIKSKVSFYDHNNIEIYTTETNVLGMGSAPLLLSKDETYTAKAFFSDGTWASITLPAAKSSGYGIAVNIQVPDKFMVQLNTTADLVNGDDVYLVAQYDGVVVYGSRQKLSNKEILFQVPKKDLPNGVLQFTILNSQFIPIVERLAFNYNPALFLPLQIKPDQPNYDFRKKVSIQLESGSASDTLRYASLSAAVVNSNKIEKNTENNALSMVSDILLKSDVKGFIENPDYYFQKDSVKLTEIDYLMLTQGWRKLDWQKYTSDSVRYQPEKGLTIAGTIKKLARKATVQGAKVTLIPTSNLLLAVDTTTNANGRFMFDDVAFADSAKFILTARSAKEKSRLDIDLDADKSAALSSSKDSSLFQNNINTIYQKELKNSNEYLSQLENIGVIRKSILLSEVKITREKNNKKVSENSRNLNGPGRADQIITAEDLSTMPTLEMALNGRLMGVMFKNGIPYSTRSMNTPMQVVLDGMYIEGDQMSMINVQDVESVEVLRSPSTTAIYGQYGAGGLLIITTKSGLGLASTFTPTGIINFIPKGYHINATFFKPVYDVENPTKLPKDVRTTIHWEPNIIVDEHGQAHFDFYTSDEKGPYKITVEGLDFTGRIVHKELNIPVE